MLGIYSADGVGLKASQGFSHLQCGDLHLTLKSGKAILPVVPGQFRLSEGAQVTQFTQVAQAV